MYRSRKSKVLDLSTKRSWALLLLLALCTLIHSGCSSTYVEGNSLSFAFEDLDGNTVSLADEGFKDKVVVVDLWGIWCPPCRDLIPHLNAYREKYAQRGLEIVGVHFGMYELGTQEERNQGLKDYAEEMDMKYTILVGGEAAEIESTLPEIRGFLGFPTTIVIGRDGLVKSVMTGFTAKDAAALEQKIVEALDEKPTA